MRFNLVDIYAILLFSATAVNESCVNTLTVNHPQRQIEFKEKNFGLASR